ncbi:MAG TPA: hypothetical protein VK612_03060 [Pyrinomonadaceae bacterium]|nr:hypothetical protein [Pyrinomonadaceae bacterium]
MSGLILVNLRTDDRQKFIFKAPEFGTIGGRLYLELLEGIDRN